MESSTQLLVRNTSLPCTDLDGELVFLGLKEGKYFGLKGTGRRIWEILAEPMTAEDLIRALAAEYRIEPDLCKADALPFLEKLSKNGLLTTSTAE